MINIQHLRYAVEVEKTSSITQAAENLFMGQPNLSKAIKELEVSVGMSIFKRSTRGVVPTERGKDFLNYAKNILAQIDEMDSLFNAGDEKKTFLKVAVPRASYITHAFTEFLKTVDLSNSIEIDFKETNSTDIINKVSGGECNLGIIRYQDRFEEYFLKFIAEKHLTYEFLWEFEYLILMNKKHPLAKKKSITYSEICKFIEITHGDNRVPTLSYSEVKKTMSAEVPWKRVYVYERGSQFDILSNNPETFIWVSPIPEVLEEKYGLVQRRCNSENFIYKDVLVYQRGHRLSATERRFHGESYSNKGHIIAMYLSIKAYR